jgi:hypothetical protein
MKGLALLIIHLLALLARRVGPGGIRGLLAENLRREQPLLVLGRARPRAPNLSPLERFVLGLRTLRIAPSRLPKSCARVTPSTLFKFHQCLVRRKYRALCSSRRSGSRPGSKAVSRSDAVLELVGSRAEAGFVPRLLQREPCSSLPQRRVSHRNERQRRVPDRRTDRTIRHRCSLSLRRHAQQALRHLRVLDAVA